MAEAVIQFYSASGNLQVTGSGGIGYGLSATGSLTLVDDGVNHPQPMVVGTVTVNGVNPVLAWKASGAICLERTTVNGSTFTFRLRAQSRNPIGLQYWVFDTAAQSVKDPTMAGIAAEVRDEHGVVTFDATMASMRVADAIETPKTSNTVPQGRVVELSSTTDITVPAGRVYAIAQSTPAFVFTTYDSGGYSNSPTKPNQQMVDDGEGPIGTPRWREQTLQSYQATGGYVGGNVIRVGLTRFENFYQGWVPGSSQPFIEVLGQARHLLIDVTNFTSAGGISPTIVSGGVNATSRSVSTGGAQTISQSTTPAVTVSASGGSAPYSYLWQFVSGDDQVSGAGQFTGASFQTTTVNQPAGTTRSAVWRCRITDAGGFIGYSPDVTFTHVAEAYSVDVSPDALTLGEINLVTNDPTGWLGTTTQIAGINQPITLRVERYDYSGSLSACTVFVYRGPTANGPWTQIGSFDVRAGGFQSCDAQFTNGEFLHYAISAETTERRRTGQFRIVVHNLTAGNVVSDRWNYVTVDADDNYTVPDYTLDPIGWDNIASSSGLNDASAANAYRTLNGINRQISLRATITSVSGNLSAGSRLEMWVNGQFRYHSTNLANGSWAGGDFNPGEQVAFVARSVSSDGQTRSGSYNVSVVNMTTGASLNTFNVNQTIAAVDTQPDPASFQDINIYSNDPDVGWVGTESRVTGINRPLTLRIERYGYNGNLDAAFIDYQVVNAQGQVTDQGYFDVRGTDQYDYRYRDVVVENDYTVRYWAHGITNGGRKSAGWNMTIWRMDGSSQKWSERNVNVTVDADNNYWPPDWTTDPLRLNDISLYTNEPSGWTNNCEFQITGINQPITLRFNRGNQSDSGGIFTRRLYIYRTSNGGASWDEFAIGAGANNTVDIGVNNGDIFHIRAYCDTGAGRGDTSFTTWITNLTTGAGLGSFNCYATVDADNNYNVVGPPVVTLDTYYLTPGHEFYPSNRNVTVEAGSVTATVSGGTAPYAYQWERLDGLSTWTIGYPTSASTFISFRGRTNFFAEANFRLKVTDAQGRVAYSEGVYAQVSAGDALI